MIDPSGHSACDVAGADPECEGLKINRRPTSPPQSTPPLTSNPVQPSRDPEVPNTFGIDPGPSIQNQCTPNYPCMSSWKTPEWWDTNPKHPDYYGLSISAGEGIGGTGILVFDRYGNVYVGIGGNIGKSITPVTGSFNGGWIGSALDDDIPDAGNIGSFLTGLSVNAQVGIVGNGAVTWSPSAGDYISHTAVEYGGVIPYSIGVSATYSFKLIDTYTFHGR